MKKNLDAQSIMELLNKHNDILRKCKVKKIGLFGSYAKGRQNKHSDIDFLVEFEEPTFDNFMDLVFYLEELFDRRVEILTPDGIKSIRIKEISQDIKRSVIYA